MYGRGGQCSGLKEADRGEKENERAEWREVVWTRFWRMIEAMLSDIRKRRSLRSDTARPKSLFQARDQTSIGLPSLSNSFKGHITARGIGTRGALELSILMQYYLPLSNDAQPHRTCHHELIMGDDSRVAILGDSMRETSST